jgi:HAD superfamily hydrolase (TIGR01548 family)
MSAAYSVPRSAQPTDLHLDANEGALCADHEDRRYPDLRELRARLATLWKAREEELLLTAGADDALERVLRFALRERREVVLPVPAFEMIERYARGAGGIVRAVPYDRRGYPLEGVLAACSEATGLIAVVSPDNPTGAVIAADQWEHLERRTRGIPKLVDLAYIEFADEDCVDRVRASPDAIVVRTLSKAWGMAGLRIGGAIAAPATIEALRAIGAPYPVSSASARIAMRRLVAGPTGIEQVRSERARLRELLAALGAHPWPSQANFVLAETRDPEWIRDACAGMGIAVRAFPGRDGLERAVRIACPGDEAAYRRLEAALACVFAPEALLFDMDGVLADVSRSYRVAILETVRAFGGVADPGAIARAKRAGDANDDWELSRKLLAEQGIAAGLADVVECFERVYAERELHREESLRVDRERLRRWSRSRPMCVVTGRPRRDAERFLEQHSIGDCFRVVVAREDAPIKPDPAPVRLALTNLGVERAWMLGDTPDDIVAARASGVLALGVSAPGEHSVENIACLSKAGAARVWSEVPDLEELL